ncbi:MAG: hypothetical protein HYY86_01820 [Candidatus Harrisonbacteria bacterium]|nr:hypothetical protein [Candidatus Harrisonbacteria bacterium]
MEEKEKIEKIKKDFNNHPCIKEKHKFQLDGLTERTAIVSTPVTLALCVKEEGTYIVNGGELGALANFAGVQVAKMQCERFPPLIISQLRCYRKTIFGKDKKILAWAELKRLTKKLVFVEARIANEEGESKAIVKLIYSNRDVSPD